MATVDLTAADFEQTITTHDIVLVDFWASWCGPCRQFAPVYEQASAQHPDVVFGKVDTEAERELAGMAQITSIPTLMAFRERVLVFSQPGALPPQALEQVIAGVKGLDMEEVRRQVESGGPDEVDVDQLAELHAAGATVLDVREDHEWAEGHIAGARHIPVADLPSRLSELPRDEPVFVVCHAGGRSARMTELLRSEGFTAVNVAGGMSDWEARGFAIER